MIHSHRRIQLAKVLPAILSVSVFMTIGFVLLQVSQAASFVVASETEAGTVGGPAKIRDVAGASGGKVVAFSPVNATIKEPIKGLLDRRAAPTGVYQDVLGGFVVEGRWSELQPTQGGAIAANNDIDQAITDLRAINSAKAGRDLQLKVRLFAGTSAPMWAKNLGGSAVLVDDPVDGGSGQIGRFWTASYRDAYNEFVTKLAEKYDSVPEIREVTIARCMTVYAEPFIRQVASASTVDNLLAAGYTVEADKQCHREQIDAHKAWATTRSSIALSPYQVVDDDPQTPTGDISFTNDMAAYCRQSLGERCVLGNNTISWPLKTGSYTSMYNTMISLGEPITFQTATACKIGDWRATLDWALDTAKAYAVELPSANCTSGGVTYYSYKNAATYPVAELADYNQRFRALP